MADPVHLTLNDEFDVTLENIRDADGAPATFDGVPGWATTDATIADLRVAADGLGAIVGSLTTYGAATITITGDARQGSEVVPKIAVISVIVAPGDVDVFDATVGPVRPRAVA